MKATATAISVNMINVHSLLKIETDLQQVARSFVNTTAFFYTVYFLRIT